MAAQGLRMLVTAETTLHAWTRKLDGDCGGLRAWNRKLDGDCGGLHVWSRTLDVDCGVLRAQNHCCQECPMGSQCHRDCGVLRAQNHCGGPQECPMGSQHRRYHQRIYPNAIDKNLSVFL